MAACGNEQDAKSLLTAISAWNTHTMKLNTLGEASVKEQFERFCPPYAENNRRGGAKRMRGKGPIADFAFEANALSPRLPLGQRHALERVVSDVEAEAEAYERFSGHDALDAFYELLPVWCLQDRMDLVTASWWDDVDLMQFLAQRMSEKFRALGHAESYCTYFIDSVNEALDGYLREVEVLAILEHRRWCEERLAIGWRYAKTKNIAAKESPYLTNWESLPERAREWNRCAARDIPLLLSAEGLAISS